MDSKKSLQFFIPKEKTKTVLRKHLYHPHQLLNTLRTVIKTTPEDILHKTGSPRPSSRTTGKHVPHRKKAFPTQQESPYRDTEKALPQPGKHCLATQKHTLL